MKSTFIPNYTQCEVMWGQLINPAASSLSAFGISLDTNRLGKLWSDKGHNGEDARLLRIVKNASSGTLAYRKLFMFDNDDGDFNTQVDAVTAADGDPVGGAVEEAYTGGVPDGYWFRSVVWCPKFPAVLANQNSSRIALAPGDRIVAASNGEFWKQLLFATTDTPATADALRDEIEASYSPSILAQIQNRCGIALVTTTNVLANRGAEKDIYLDLV